MGGAMNSTLYKRTHVLLRSGLRHLILFVLAIATTLASADGFDYALKPQRIADDTWVLVGRSEDFTIANGANIVNTAFVVTGAGVVVIDSGPSRYYGEQFRQAIASVTAEPIVKVLITHYHPDHFLGNQAFALETLHALPDTISGIARDGNAFAENLYRLSGDAMHGTEVRVPPKAITPGQFTVGTHRFEVLALDGHTGADLALFDLGTGVLFTGDLVFNGRAPTTPHARIEPWLASLERLDALGARIIVPGHGAVSEAMPASQQGKPASSPHVSIAQTRDYLRWLNATLKEAAEQGLDMSEALALPLPPQIQRMAVSASEFRRSVSHLYPAAEQDALTHAHSHRY
jgi:uncharacterized sulfatase